MYDLIVIGKVDYSGVRIEGFSTLRIKKEKRRILLETSFK